MKRISIPPTIPHDKMFTIIYFIFYIRVAFFQRICKLLRLFFYVANFWIDLQLATAISTIKRRRFDELIINNFSATILQETPLIRPICVNYVLRLAVNFLPFFFVNYCKSLRNSLRLLRTMNYPCRIIRKTRKLKKKNGIANNSKLIHAPTSIIPCLKFYENFARFK